jgi:PAS domain S-box-containing protein
MESSRHDEAASPHPAVGEPRAAALSGARRGEIQAAADDTRWPMLSRLRGGIGLRLLGSVLLFSSVVTLTLTALQLYLDYNREVRHIETRLSEIERSYLGSLSESLWNLDKNQLEIQLNGILRLPAIRSAAVHETTASQSPLILFAGDRATHSAISREFPLVRTIQGREQSIGVFSVVATLTEVYQELLNRASIILVSQAAKTFLVSLFILYIVHWLVTRHLTSIAGFVGGYDLARPPPALTLQRRPPKTQDELDKVVVAFNGLFASLQRAYDDLRKTNAELERDIVARRRAEEALRQSEQRFRDYAESSSDWFWESDANHVFTYISDQITAFGVDRAALSEVMQRRPGRRRTDVALDLETEPEKWRNHIAALERHEPFRNFEYKRPDSSGRICHLSVNGQPIFDAEGKFIGYRGTARDITEQREAEERLRQSQKMDAIGQLTGGIAHDFNNLLTIIIGNADVLTEQLPDESQRRLAALIGTAGERGADLTRHLLAFSRRQALRPRLVDVNALLANMDGLLRRALGEQIEIELVRAAGLWRTFIDPAQLESSILNLAINSRDAMPQGGKLTIETGNAHIDQHYADSRGDVRPGQYVMVAVADTGTGMTPEVIARAFEPFFTTKALGTGTGLGLSMVYGFVKQSGGHVNIYSELGHGSIVRLYLPRGTGTEQEALAPEETKVAATGTETILLVEDEELVRSHVGAQLARLGYTVIAVPDGPSALAELNQNKHVDLLFTDVVMPGGMNGRQVAEEAKKLRPGIKVLFTSGYTENVVVHHGRLDPGVQLLNKPYRMADMARKIRAVLDGR